MTTKTLTTRTDTDGGSYDPQLYSDGVRAPLIDASATLTAEMLGDYGDLGFLAMTGVIREEEVLSGLAGLAHLVTAQPAGVDIQLEAFASDNLADLSTDALLDIVRKFSHFVHADDRLRAIASHPNILGPVRQILGTDDVVLFQDMALLKPPRGGREKPWHQDKAFLPISLESPIVGVWIALDEATPKNGCMHVIPGSHNEGPIAHVIRRDWQICDANVATARDVVVPLTPGSALFFDGLLHHGTPQNHTDTRRRALQFHYIRADAVATNDEERLLVFGPEGAKAEC